MQHFVGKNTDIYTQFKGQRNRYEAQCKTALILQYETCK